MREGHRLISALEANEPLLGSPDDALGLHVEGQVDDDAQGADGPEQRRSTGQIVLVLCRLGCTLLEGNQAFSFTGRES